MTVLALCLFLGAVLPVAATETASDEAPPPVASILADLPPQVRQEIEKDGGTPAASRDAEALLEAVFQASTPYEFGGGAIVARTDPRWYATLPPEGEGAPLLELRRWPGDTVLALYAVRGAREGESDYRPPVRGAEFVRLGGSRPELAIWEGLVRTDAGERPALWVEQRVAEGQARLGALILAGDAGLGAAGIGGLTDEALVALGRVEILRAPWKNKKAVPVGVPLILPTTGGTPGDKDEKAEPWQVASAREFTMGLPPGFRARRMDGGVPPPDPIPGGRLWIRGRCLDTEGSLVVVGDARRFGYVARVEPLTKQWSSGSQPPAGAPGAQRLASEGFPLVAERTRAERATAERWGEPGFAGQWLVFRLQFADHGYEIALPVVTGRQSESLFWIPASWREAGRPPAPPPVDPAERFGIKFERLTRGDRQKQPWMEGYLTVPGLRAEVSSGWIPASSLRSADGYPVRFLNFDGLTIGSLTRLGADEIERRAESFEGMEESNKPGRHGARRVLRDESGRQLFVSSSGDGYLFELTPPSESEMATSLEEILELWNLMMRSVKLQR